jgi:hypothetical protein
MSSRLLFILIITVMANKLPEGQFPITDGPSKYDLQASLFDGKIVQITCGITAKTSPNLKVTASFKIIPRLKVIFQKIGVEDGSHDSWFGEVYFCEPNYENEHRKFYYDTRRRTGHISEITK